MLVNLAIMTRQLYWTLPCIETTNLLRNLARPWLDKQNIFCPLACLVLPFINLTRRDTGWWTVSGDTSFPASLFVWLTHQSERSELLSSLFPFQPWIINFSCQSQFVKSRPEILNPDSPLVLPFPPLSPPSHQSVVQFADMRCYNITENPGLCVAVMKLYLSPGTSATWTIGLVALPVGHLTLGAGGDTRDQSSRHIILF